MQWLVIAFLVSLCALLLAAAGMAIHVWLRRAHMRAAEQPEAVEFDEETDLESRI